MDRSSQYIQVQTAKAAAEIRKQEKQQKEAGKEAGKESGEETWKLTDRAEASEEHGQ